jgi:hypothetical protein
LGKCNTDHAEAIERLIELSTKRSDLIDWNVLENMDEVAWSD